MIRHFRLLLPAFFWVPFLLPISDATAASKRTVVLSCTNFPPSKIEHSPKGLPGYAIEFLRSAFSRSRTDVEFKFYPWKRALKLAINGSVDGLCSCSRNPERDKTLIYSDLLGENNIAIFFNKSATPDPFSSLDTLSGQEVAVVRGYNLHQELIRHNVKPFPVNNETSGIKMLINNRADLFYSFKAPALFALSKFPKKNNIGFLVLKTTPYFACFNKFIPDSDIVVKNLNEGLTAIRVDGTYDRILEKYR